jgi:pantoate--beta-alanine ligase
VDEASTIAALRAHVAARRASGRTIGLVPTMGALHEGHLELVRRCAEHVDDVVVSIFVNPTQFDRADDLAAYPRDPDRDASVLRALGDATPTVLFAPSVDEVYPTRLRVSVTVRGGLTDGLCGASRPGHFDAVATVVTKLVNLVQPDLAVFGRKDRQQLQVIRQVVADLNLPVALLGVPTVREPDGVAMSSRNRRLDAEHRERARALSRALVAAVGVARTARSAGESIPVTDLRSAAWQVLTAAPGLDVDYLEVVDPDTMQPGEPEIAPDARVVVAVAAEVGPVRLIDNVEVGDPDDEHALLRAVTPT